jgi:hypothetical protein
VHIGGEATRLPHPVSISLLTTSAPRPTALCSPRTTALAPVLAPALAPALVPALAPSPARILALSSPHSGIGSLLYGPHTVTTPVACASLVPAFAPARLAPALAPARLAPALGFAVRSVLDFAQHSLHVALAPALVRALVNDEPLHASEGRGHDRGAHILVLAAT